MRACATNDMGDAASAETTPLLTRKSRGATGDDNVGGAETTPLLKREKTESVPDADWAAAAPRWARSARAGDDDLEGAPTTPPSTPPPRTFRAKAAAAAPVAAALAILVVALLGTAALGHRRRTVLNHEKTVLDIVKQRTWDVLENEEQMCAQCSVVLPSKTYAGRGLGQLIDASECVVRFNDHDAAAAPPEDYGARDDVRVINGKPETGWALWDDPCLNGGCRRTFMTVNSGVESSKFLEAGLSPPPVPQPNT